MRPSTIAFSAILLPVILLGAGCSKKTTPPTSPAAQQATPQPSTNPPVVAFPGQSPDQSVNDQLNAVLSNFRDVKSFRVKFTLPSGQGSVSTTLSFLKPNRFSGSMQIKDQAPFDIIVVDNSMYMRVPGAGWMDLTGTQSSSALGNSLKNALNGDTSLSKLGVDPSTSVSKSHDEARGCDIYKARVMGQEGGPATLQICAVNGLPKFVDIAGQNGTLSFEYYDYNKLFLIERPVVGSGK